MKAAQKPGRRDARVRRRRSAAIVLAALAALGSAGPASADQFYFTRTRALQDAQQGATGLFLWNDASGAQSQIGGDGSYLRHATDGPMPVDGIATNLTGTLYGFAIDDATTAGFLPWNASAPCTSNQRSRLVSINTATGVISYVGPWLTGRHINGAAFDGQGRLWGMDCASDSIVQISPTSGLVVGAPIAAGLGGSTTSDIEFAANGMGIIGYGGLQFRVFDPAAGWVASVPIAAVNSGFDGTLAPPYAISGIAFTSHLSARNGSPQADACRLNLVEGRGIDELGHANDPFFANPVVARKEVNQYDPPNRTAGFYNGGPGDGARAGGPALPECFYDWGDAPNSYGTLRSSSGPQHAIVAGGPYLGADLPDFEVDGQPNANAAGDDGAGTDDEDGVVFPPLGAGTTVQIQVQAGNVSAATRLQAWIDWDDDGSFAQPGDRILTDAVVAAGTNTFEVDVPATAKVGTTHARFRIANQSGLGYLGLAGSGEVEDHAVQVAEVDADLSITKDDGSPNYTPGNNVTYTIVVRNDGPAAVQDAVVTDPLPTGVSSATWTCGSATNGGVCDVASGSGPINTTVDLPANASVTFSLTMFVPSTFSGNLVNTAAVAVPANATDSNPANNSATDTDTQWPPPATNVATITCTAGGNLFNTAYDGAGGRKTSGTDTYWQVALTTTPVNGAPPASLTYAPAQVVSAPPAVYIVSPYGNANWVSHAANALHPTNGNYDVFYRFQFNIGPGVDPGAMTLNLEFYSDNAVYEVWVNGAAQGVRSNYGAADPYFYAGFVAGNAAAGVLDGPWQNGLNEIVVHVKSGPGAQAFLAQVLPPAAVCDAATVSLNKSTRLVGGGPFGFALTNTTQPTGTVATTAADTPAQVDGDAASAGTVEPFSVAAFGTDVVITENALPAGWTLENATCTSGGTPVGSRSGSAYTIPGSVIDASGESFVCTFTNLPSVDLSVVKNASATDVRTGDTVTYTLAVSNSGPGPADGAIVSDPMVSGLDCSTGTLTCGGEAGGAVCPAAPTVADLQGGGLAIPTLPAGGSLQLMLTCTVTASGAP